MHINADTGLNLVIGCPLAHTQSPFLHNFIYQYLNINAVLLAFSHENLASMMKAIKILGVPLTAITLPYKIKACDYLDESSQEVQALGAINTIIQCNGKLKGYNTDIDGIAFALRHTTLSGKTVLMIGAGGAAYSATWVLQEKKANVIYYNRDPTKAKALARRFAGEWTADCASLQSSIDIIINATPVGMYPHLDLSPLPNYHFNSQQTVFDMIYSPAQTALLKQAKSQGATIISGLDMFIVQALRQVEIWQKKSIMTDSLIAELKQELIQRNK